MADFPENEPMEYSDAGTTKAAVEIRSVTKKFKTMYEEKEFTALDGVSLSVLQGEFLVIAGANGSGKTLLMSVIAGLEEADSGTVEFPAGGEAGLIFQDADAQILGETPEEDVCFGLKSCGYPKRDLQSRARNALARCGLLEKKDFPARLMSGGEKRRLAVASMIAMQRAVMIFDEPFANLDWPGIRQVCAILKSLKEEGYTVLVLTHELEKILALADRLAILDKGKIRFSGLPEDALRLPLEDFGIRNPMTAYNSIQDMLWI